jgi:hypothetical protein
MSSSIIDKISRIADGQVVESGKKLLLDDSHLYIFVEGEGKVTNGDGSKEEAVVGAEYGWRPYTYSNPVGLVAKTSCGLIKLKAETYLELLKSVPQLNYQTRRRLAAENPEAVDWLLGEMPIYQA